MAEHKQKDDLLHHISQAQILMKKLFNKGIHVSLIELMNFYSIQELEDIINTINILNYYDRMGEKGKQEYIHDYIKYKLNLPIIKKSLEGYKQHYGEERGRKKEQEAKQFFKEKGEQEFEKYLANLKQKYDNFIKNISIMQSGGDFKSKYINIKKRYLYEKNRFLKLIKFI